jgi:hypothetical protein
MVRGFKLTALNEKTKEHIKMLSKKKDSKAQIIVLSEAPYTVSFLFNARFSSFIPKQSVIYYIGDYMKDAQLNADSDYKLEVIE